MSAVQPAEHPYSGPQAGRRVLVVDDEPAICNLLADALRQEFRVACSSSGEDALQVIEAHPPDVLLVDKNLPGMTGLELVRQAKSRDPHLACVIITGHSSTQSAVEALRLGAFDYLIKPCDVQATVETIRRAADRQQLIDQRHQAEQALRESEDRFRLLVEVRTRQLVNADRLAVVGQLATGVGHEINNPAAFVIANLNFQTGLIQRLRAALGELQGLASAGRDPTSAQAIESILTRHEFAASLAQLSETLRDNLQGMDRIRSVTRDLQTFARLDTDEVELIDVNQVIRAAANMTANEIRHRAKLEFDLAPLPGLPAMRNGLAQVLTNLLVNAAQAIQEGAAEKNRIQLRSRFEADRVLIEVADSGCGIPAGDLERIFEPFYTTKPSGQGTGLGLALCRDIIGQHAGELRASSQPGQGSRFEISLPVANGLVPRAACPRTTHQPSASRRRARVLIIDDDSLLLKTFLRVLSLQHEVSTAEGGQIGLALLQKRRDFDVILCDLMMPNLDGPMFFEALRDLDPALLDRVVFMSGGAFTRRIQEFVGKLPNHTLPKPIDFGRLLDLISSLHPDCAEKP